MVKLCVEQVSEIVLLCVSLDSDEVKLCASLASEKVELCVVFGPELDVDYGLLQTELQSELVG